MIETRSSCSSGARQGFSVARVVVKPDYRNVPLRVLNACTTQIKLVTGKNLADFCPLIELCLSQRHVCGVVGNKTTPQVISDKIESIIDPPCSDGISLELIKLSSINKVSLVYVSSCINTGSIRDDPQCTSRKNSLDLIEIFNINIVRSGFLLQ